VWTCDTSGVKELTSIVFNVCSGPADVRRGRHRSWRCGEVSEAGTPPTSGSTLSARTQVVTASCGWPQLTSPGQRSPIGRMACRDPAVAVEGVDRDDLKPCAAPRKSRAATGSTAQSVSSMFQDLVRSDEPSAGLRYRLLFHPPELGSSARPLGELLEPRGSCVSTGSSSQIRSVAPLRRA